MIGVESPIDNFRLRYRRPVRLLWVSPLYLPDIGGIELLGSRVLPRLVARGIEPVVLASHGPRSTRDHEVVDGVEVHRVAAIGALEARDPRAVLAVSARIRAVKERVAADVVHLHGVAPMTWFERRHPGTTPSVLTVHNTLRPYSGGASAELLSSVTRVVFCSEATRRDALPHAPDVADRSTVIWYGVPIPPDVAPLPADPVVLCPARLVPAKGLHHALEAVAALLPRFPTLRLVLAGEGPEEARLRAEASRLDVERHVDFLGAVPPDLMPDVYRRATVVALPSVHEGMPIALMEAASHGRPAVAFGVDGVPEAVVDGSTGIVVTPGDTAQLAAALGAVLGDRALAERLGAGARARAETHFDIDVCTDAHAALYGRLVG